MQHVDITLSVIDEKKENEEDLPNLISYPEDPIIQSDEKSNRSESSKRSTSTTIIILPQATFAFPSNNDSEINYYVKLSHKLHLLSLFFFFFAGAFSIFSASWDYYLTKNAVHGFFGRDIIICSEKTMFGDMDICALQTIVAFLSGFGYFMSGLVDICITRLYDKSKSILKQKKQDIKINLSYPTNLLLESAMYNSFSDVSESSPLLRKNINNPHAIHKLPSIVSYSNTTFNQECVVGTLLALAGFIECTGDLLEPSHKMISSLLDLLSCILYFLEATVALFGMSLCSRCLHSYDDNDIVKNNYKIVYYLDKSGDVLFFIGSFIDLTCSVFWLFCDDMQLYSWNVFSSVLWTVDALLYIMGDVVHEKMLSKDHSVFDTVLDSINF